MGASELVKVLPATAPERREVLRYLGYRGQEAAPAFEDRLAELEGRCLDLACPRACLRIFEVGSASVATGDVPELSLKGCALVLRGHDIAAHLAGARSVGLMAVTLGTQLERELRRLSLTDTVAAMLLDAIATAMVEQAADAAEQALADEARAQGLATTWRYSPGYGDFPLESQAPLLAALDAQRRLGITLTDSLLMIPTKSVTAVVGMFDGPVAGGFSSQGERPTCDACTLAERCSVRAKGSNCHA